jgi:parallel beta-helix repeat protein
LIAENNVTASVAEGVCLNYSSSDNIVDNYIIGNQKGLRLRNTSLSKVCGNTLMSNTQFGISLDSISSYNEIRENTIQESYYGILIFGLCPKNTIYHNNLIHNTDQANSMSGNSWDNGCEGNYWSNYIGLDLDNDGVGDTYLPWEAVDNYPLMNLYWNPTDINHDLKVDIKDVSRAARAFGTHSGELLWNPHADTTGEQFLVPDGKVDIRDISLIAKNFGKQYS